MTVIRTMMTLGFVGLFGCSIIAKGKAKLGGSEAPQEAPAASSISKPGAIDAPKVAADKDDPPPVKNALARLDSLDVFFQENRWSDYARESANFHAYFIFEDGLKDQDKRGAIMKRLDALDAAAFKTFPRLHALVGEGTRVLEGGIDTDALEPIVVVLNACSGTDDIRSKEALSEKTAAYEKAVARVGKVDKKVFRYYGDTDSRFGTTDVATALLECEANLAASASQFEEEYVAETVPETQAEVGCGSAHFLADGIRVGRDRYADYSRSAGGASYPEKISCNKLKKKNKYPKGFASVVKDYAAYIEIPVNELIVVTDGKPYVDVSPNDHDYHRYQNLIAYSKKFRFAANPCGGKEVFCEAGGSRGAGAFNRMEHALDRAKVHAGAKPDVCKRHLKNAIAQASWFAEFVQESQKSGSWIAGATYKTKKGKKLKEKDFIATFEEQGQLADDRLLGKYCDQASK